MLYENHFITWREDFDAMSSANWKSSDKPFCRTHGATSRNETSLECKNVIW
jgi:hypothetical protein